MIRNRRVQERPVFIVVLALAVSAAVAGISWSGWLEGPEKFYGDLWQRLAGEIPTAARGRSCPWMRQR